MPDMRKIIKFQILNHGIEHAQYFQGCGTAFTGFDHVVTGCGSSSKDAYQDAVDQIALLGNVDTEGLPVHPKGISVRERVKRWHSEEHYAYVSIRYNLDGEDEEPAAEVEEPVPCPACGGDGGLLGKLGSLSHFTCRQCGAQFSKEV